MKKLIFLIVGILVCPILIPTSASAATSASLSLVPASGSHVIGNVFSVAVTVDTQGTGAADSINAAGVNSMTVPALTFDKTILAVSSISADNSAGESVFTTWVKFPSYSNANGVIYFSGGVPQGFTGQGTIFIINFRGIALGTGNVSYTNDVKVYSNDGKGTEDAVSSRTGGAYTILPVPPGVSCSASPSSAIVNAPVTFSASASGGVGNYSYTWSGDCIGTSSSCTNTFATTGPRSVTVTASSGSDTFSGHCSVNVNYPGLNVSCLSPDSVNTGDSVTFTGSASGGKTGDYSYSWSGDCAGAGTACTNSFTTAGIRKATVTATSGGNSSSADCVMYVNLVCPPPGGVGSGSGNNIINISNITDITNQVKKIFTSQQGSATTKVVSALGLLAVIANAFPFFNILLFLLRLLGLDMLLLALGLKKKALPWGVAYNSVTKQSVDLVRVVLKDLQGKEISSAVTDTDGRYGFLVEPGIYQMQAYRKDYVFPSVKLIGATHDELYSDLYFSGNIEIKNSGETIVKNIPLDPVKFDWEQFAKSKNTWVFFYPKFASAAGKIYNFIFAVGFISAILSYLLSQDIYDTIVLVLYLLFMFFMVFGFRPKARGYIYEKATGKPLPFAILRVFSQDTGTEVASKSADKYGRYYCLVSPGRYFVKIEKKKEDGSYALVYTSPIFNASRQGVIKEKFEV